MALTPKQEHFCRCIAQGMDGKTAYYTAYDTTCNEKVAYNEASKLLARDEIAAKVKELQVPLENHARSVALSDRDKKRAILWAFINDATLSTNERLNAMNILNRMDADYYTAPAQDEKQNDLEKVDTSTLLRLVKDA